MKYVLILVLLVGTAHAGVLDEVHNQSIEKDLVLNVVNQYAKEINTSAALEACDKPGVAASLRPDPAKVTLYSMQEFSRLQLVADRELSEDQRMAAWTAASKAVQHSLDAYHSGVKHGAKLVLGSVGNRKLDFCDWVLEMADEMLAEESE